MVRYFISVLSRSIDKSEVFISLHHYDWSLKDMLCKHQPYLIVAISGHPRIGRILETWVAVSEGYRLDRQRIRRISKGSPLERDRAHHLYCMLRLLFLLCNQPRYSVRAYKARDKSDIGTAASTLLLF